VKAGAKKFKNNAHKARVVLSVFNPGEKLTAQEIVRRLKKEVTRSTQST